MSEWSKVPHLKCGAPKGAVGSNPTASARIDSLAQSEEHMPVTHEVRGSKPLRVAKNYGDLAEHGLRQRIANPSIEET